MTGVIDLLAGAFGGSIVGAIGGTAQKFIEGRSAYKLLEEKNNHEVRMAQVESEQMRLQLESQRAVAQIDADVQLAKADSDALVASLENDAARYSQVDTSKANKWLVAVDVVRGLMRPIITGGLATYCVFVTAYNLYNYGAEMPADAIAATTFTLIESMATYTGLAISWWFGSRGHIGGK